MTELFQAKGQGRACKADEVRGENTGGNVSTDGRNCPARCLSRDRRQGLVRVGVRFYELHPFLHLALRPFLSVKEEGLRFAALAPALLVGAAVDLGIGLLPTKRNTDQMNFRDLRYIYIHGGIEARLAPNVDHPPGAGTTGNRCVLGLDGGGIFGDGADPNVYQAGRQ